MLTERQSKNFWSKVYKTDGCWFWQASVDKHGYGQVRIGPKPGRLWYSHRLSYLINVGEIPNGYVIDHLCAEPLCVNPEHLEAVTQAENVRRGRGNGYKNRTHCIHGHEYTDETTRWWNGFRSCIPCKVAYDKNRREVARYGKTTCRT